jgi:osmotically-inducible protein OsmY
MRRVFFGLAMSLAAIAPSWARGDDQQIAQSIVTELKAHQDQGRLRGFKIDLQVEDGTVLLTGRVSDAEQQKLAVEIAKGVTGVRQVVNDLEITAARPAATAQESPRRFPLSNLNPLKLLGNRDEEAEPAPTPAPRPAQPAAEPVEEAALPPPVHVQAEAAPARAATPAPAPIAAAVAAPQASSDEQIAQEVFRRLQQVKADGRLHGFRLDMKVEDGSVLLDGHVSSPDQKHLTLEIARRVPGVYQVVDMIQVDAPNQVQPASIADTSARRTHPARIAASQVAAAQTAPATLQPTPAQPIMAAPQMAYYVAQPQALGLQQAMPIPAHYASTAGIAQVRYDHPQLPGYAWPSYAAYPNYAGVTYPKQYSPAAWPYIGPFYPYPQVPLGWRKVTLQWSDGWWFLDFKER